MRVVHGIIAVALLPLISAAAACDVKCPLEWMTDTTKALQSSPTLVDLFPRDNATTTAVRNAVAFFERLGPRLYEVDERYDMPRVCTTGRNDGAVIAASGLSAHRGLGCIEECLWKVHHATRVESERQAEAKRLFEQAKLLSDATVDAGWRLNNDTDLGFKFVSSPQFMRGTSDTNQCDMVKISAQRVNDRWMLRPTIYDLENPYELSEKPGKTMYFQLMYLDERDTPTSLPFNLTYCSKPRDLASRFQKRATALVAKWDAKPSWSDWRTRNISENPAIRHGMMDSEISATVFSEIDTLSGVAIFLLPLVLALMPAALFTNIRSVGDLAVYIGMDVVAAIPLALKSFEFLTDSRAARYFAEAFYYGSQNNTGPAAAELFLAKCGFISWYRKLGKGLLATTCVLSVICMSLDVYFYRMLVRKKRDYLERIHASGVGKPGSEGSWSLDVSILDEIVAELPGSDLRWFFSIDKRRKTKDRAGPVPE